MHVLLSNSGQMTPIYQIWASRLNVSVGVLSSTYYFLISKTTTPGFLTIWEKQIQWAFSFVPRCYCFSWDDSQLWQLAVLQVLFFLYTLFHKKREKGYHYTTSIYDGKVPPEILFQLLSLGFNLELFAAITKSWGLLFKHYWTLYVYKSIYKLVEYSMNYNEYSHKSSQKLKKLPVFSKSSVSWTHCILSLR